MSNSVVTLAFFADAVEICEELFDGASMANADSRSARSTDTSSPGSSHTVAAAVAFSFVQKNGLSRFVGLAAATRGIRKADDGGGGRGGPPPGTSGALDVVGVEPGGGGEGGGGALPTSRALIPNCDDGGGGGGGGG